MGVGLWGMGMVGSYQISVKNKIILLLVEI
jgi:hypothetical protein